MITSMLNSLKRRSFTISRWRSPRNPHLNHCPRAVEDSDSVCSALSLSTSFSIASASPGYSSVAMGNTPAQINGVTVLNHSIAFASSGLSRGPDTSSGFQSVSQTFASRIDLSPVTTYPTDPLSITGLLVYVGAKYPTSSASIFFPVLRKCSVSHFLICPENTLTYDTTPLYESY